MKRIIIQFFLLTTICFFSLSNENTNDNLEILSEYIITSTFGDSRDDHFHTGIDLAGPEQEVRSLMDSTLIFYNKKRERSIPYGNGNFVILESNNNYRLNYSHLKQINLKENIFYYTGETIGILGNSGHSTGNHLHFEIEDIKNKRLINPIHFLKVKDKIPPRINDIYFITNSNEKVSFLTNNKLKRGGKLFIECYDYIQNTNIQLIPYSIKVIIGGKDSLLINFSSLIKTENSYVLEENNYTFEQLYLNKNRFDFYLMDFKSLPGLVGFKIIIEDYAQNKFEFQKALRVLLPD